MKNMTKKIGSILGAVVLTLGIIGGGVSALVDPPLPSIKQAIVMPLVDPPLPNRQ